MTVWLIAAIFLLLFVSGAPLFIALGAAAVLCIAYVSHADPAMLAQQIFSIAENDTLPAIPFFVLASVLMTTGAGARRIVEFIESLVEWMPGGLGIAAVVSCVFFAAMCGLSPAAIVAVGALMLPGLLASGYPERFSIGLVTSAGSLGILIPPSLAMIVLGIVVSSTVQDFNQAEALRAARQPKPAVSAAIPADIEKWDNNAAVKPSWATSPGAASDAAKSESKQAGKPVRTVVSFENLFIGGAAPAAVIAAAFCLFSIITGVRSGAKRSKFSAAESLRRLRAGWLALALPVLVAGGILSGKLTVVQASALAALYSFTLEVFVYRSLPLRRLPRAMREAGAVAGMILIILSVTFAFNWFLTTQGIPADVSDFITRHFHSRALFLLALNIVFLVMGCIMDILSAVFISVPLILPAAMAMGIDPVHFSIMFIVNFEIGLLTPPVGVNLFTAGAVFKKDLAAVSRSVLPFLAFLIAVLAAVTYIPDFTLFLVRAFGI